MFTKSVKGRYGLLGPHFRFRRPSPKLSPNPQGVQLSLYPRLCLLVCRRFL